MEVSEAKWLKAIEEGNVRLKKLLAEQMLDNAICAHERLSGTTAAMSPTPECSSSRWHKFGEHVS